MTTTARPRVRADVFPAVLVLAPPTSSTPATSLSALPPGSDHRRLEKVRVVVTLTQVLVFQDSHTGPLLVFSEPLQDYTPAPRRGATLRTFNQPREATLTTDSGKTLAFHRTQNCGCGSRLKAFDPFGTDTQYTVASTGDNP